MTNDIQYVNDECWKVTEIHLKFVNLVKIISNGKATLSPENLKCTSNFESWCLTLFVYKKKCNGQSYDFFKWLWLLKKETSFFLLTVQEVGQSACTPLHWFLKSFVRVSEFVSLWGDFWQDCKCFFPAWKVFFIDLINEIWFR